MNNSFDSPSYQQDNFSVNNSFDSPSYQQDNFSVFLSDIVEVMSKEFGRKVDQESVKFVFEHVFAGMEWIFGKAGQSTKEVQIFIQNIGASKASILDGGNGQILVISPDLILQIQQVFEQLKDTDVSIEELEVGLDSPFEQIPSVDCLLIDYLEHIGVEEGTHWIQGLVSEGQIIDGFTPQGEAERIQVNSGEDAEAALKRYAAERDHFAEQVKPHEVNAKYWVNEYFKEKYNGNSPFQALYDAFKKILDEKESKKKPRFLRSFLGRDK